MVEEGTRPQSKRDESKCFLFIQLVLFKVISNWCDNWMNSKKNNFFTMNNKHVTQSMRGN
jgi:hypothetical protein